MLRAKLQDTEGEFLQAKEEICHLNKRLVELWQENCQQLFISENTITENEEVIHRLSRKQQNREIELARLKLANLQGAKLNETALPVTTSVVGKLPLSSSVRLKQ